MWYFWIRKVVRRFMRPVPLKKAEKYTNIYTGLYMLSAWTIAGIVLVKYVTHRRLQGELSPLHNSSNSGYYYGKLFKAENMQIIRLTGTQLQEEGIYNYSEDKQTKEKVDEFFGEE